MAFFHRVLILGTGPAAIQVAVNLKNNMGCTIGMAGRKSVRANRLFEELDKNNDNVCVQVQNPAHAALSGTCRIDQIFRGYEMVEDQWDTLFLCVTNEAYLGVIEQLDHAVIEQVNCVVLVSPTIGSNRLVGHYLNQAGCFAQVISLSTYYAATKRIEGTDLTTVLTKGVKKKIYIGALIGDLCACNQLSRMFRELGICVKQVASPYEAESKNISIYVHPPIFMNAFSLDLIFSDKQAPVKYAYKFYPEGPLTQKVMRDLLSQWKEISCILKQLAVQSVNLLKFMNDDTYPVSPQSLSRCDIEKFESFPEIKQEYLLYVRYTSLLIDPFSTPDKNGKYFDFSAVPIRRVYKARTGCWTVPRIPKEDYYRLKILQGLGQHFLQPTPTIDRFVETYESELAQFCTKKGPDGDFSEDFTQINYDDQIKVICDETRNDQHG